MKRRLIATPLMIAICAGMVLAQKPAASGKAAEDELKQIENNWTDAQRHAGAPFLRRPVNP